MQIGVIPVMLLWVCTLSATAQEVDTMKIIGLEEVSVSDSYKRTSDYATSTFLG